MIRIIATVMPAIIIIGETKKDVILFVGLADGTTKGKHNINT